MPQIEPRCSLSELLILTSGLPSSSVRTINYLKTIMKNDIPTGAATTDLPIASVKFQTLGSEGGSKRPSDAQVGGAHYKDMAIQPAEFIHRNKLGFLEGNVIKYVCRHAQKGGSTDLDKALHYLLLLKEWEYGEIHTVPVLPAADAGPVR
jgi:hypothetical protein